MPAGNDVESGPFTTRQLLRIDEVLSTIVKQTGVFFSIYVGPLEEPSRATAERKLEELPDAGRLAVLVVLSPNQKILEIVTGSQMSGLLLDHSCRLAAVTMTAAFSVGDLTGGIVTGLSMLADQIKH